MLPRALQRRVQRVDRGAGHAERGGDAFALEHVDGGVDRSHPVAWRSSGSGEVVASMPRILLQRQRLLLTSASLDGDDPVVVGPGESSDSGVADFSTASMKALAVDLDNLESLLPELVDELDSRLPVCAVARAAASRA